MRITKTFVFENSYFQKSTCSKNFFFESNFFHILKSLFLVVVPANVFVLIGLEFLSIDLHRTLDDSKKLIVAALPLAHLPSGALAN